MAVLVIGYWVLVNGIPGLGIWFIAGLPNWFPVGGYCGLGGRGGRGHHALEA